MSDTKMFDSILDVNGPVAIIIKEKLRSAGGNGSVVFPPTYAPAQDSDKSASGYNIDSFPDGGNRCTIDSVQSQANRIEETFLNEPYSLLVPQIVIKAGKKSVNLLQAAHRLGDAAVRFSNLNEKVDEAFKKFLNSGDSTLIAKLNPMSLVFGVWDSRGTHAKIARSFSSQIYATDVLTLTRSSQFIPSFTVEDIGSDIDEDGCSTAGLAHAPAKGPGGVIVNGEILRESHVNLIAIRRLKSDNPETTKKLQKYILGLTMLCATMPLDQDLRSGCLLVADGNGSFSLKRVFRNGEEQGDEIKHDEVLKYAQECAARFGVDNSMVKVVFDPKLANAYVDGKKNKGKKRNK